MAGKLNKSVLYTFGVGDLFFTVMVNMEIYFFVIFLTNYAQFPLGTVGRILGITGVADIVCALLAGFILQRVAFKFAGKYRSWLLIGPPIVAPLFILQFAKIGSDTVAASIIIFGFIASHLIFNVVFAATGSMVGSLSTLPNERTILSSSRAQGMSAAGLVFSAMAVPMITFFGIRTNETMGYTIATAVFAILMILGYWYIFRITAGGEPSSENTESVSIPENKQTVMEIVESVFKTPPLLLLIIIETFRNGSVFIVTAFAAYYFGYVLNNSGFMSMFILSISVAALLGTFAAPWIGVRIGKRNSYWLFLLLSTLSFGSAKLMGGTIWSFTIIFSIGYMCNMAAGAMSTALFADTAIYGEWKTGKSIQGFIMALLTLSIKVGILLRSGVVYLGLRIIGFEENMVPEPNVVDGISSIMIFAPAAASAIAAAVFYFGYRIEDKDIVQMQNEIASR